MSRKRNDPHARRVRRQGKLRHEREQALGAARARRRDRQAMKAMCMQAYDGQRNRVARKGATANGD